MASSCLGLAGLSFFVAVSGAAVAADWPVATPQEAGFAADLAERLDAAVADLEGDLHALVLVRGGRLVYETYLAGDDAKMGQRKSGVVFGPDTLHDLRSVTKSVVATLYGIALAEGEVPAPETPVLDAFPEYPDLAADPARKAITVGHLLSMTMGADWPEEDSPYGSPVNPWNVMNLAPDSLRFVLDRPMVAAPGAEWTYNSGATTIIGELIARGTGEDVEAYAARKLFAPLGITSAAWSGDYYGRPFAAAGLRLRPRDTAKIGQLVLDAGMWEGAQVVPADWMARATSVQAHAPNCDYGYQWWLCRSEGGLSIIEASGNGGQELLVLPELDLVLVTNAGLYDVPDAWGLGWGLLEEVILPSLAPE